MKQVNKLLGGMVLVMAVAGTGCNGSSGSGVVIVPPTPTPVPTATPTAAPTVAATPIPTATATPIAETDFVGFVHKLFAETSDTTEPADINDLDFSNLGAGPDAFNDLLK